MSNTTEFELEPIGKHERGLLYRLSLFLNGIRIFKDWHVWLGEHFGFRMKHGSFRLRNGTVYFINPSEGDAVAAFQEIYLQKRYTRYYTPKMKLYDGIEEAWAGYQQVAAMRAAVAGITRANPSAEVSDGAKAFDARLASAGGSAGGGGRGGGRGGAGGAAAGGAPPPPNFAGLNGALIRQLDTLDFGDMAPNEPMGKAYVAGCTDLKTAVTNWKAINRQDLAAFNAVLAKNNLAPIAAAAALAVPVCAPAPLRPTTVPATVPSGAR